MSNKRDYSTAFLLHLSAFFGYVFPFGGVIAPMVIWELKKDESDFINQTGKEVINFNLSFLLYTFVLGISIFPFAFRSFFSELYHFDLFGIISMVSLIGVLGVIRFVLIITAATKINQGEIYTYPLTIKFIK
ncbi:MAG: DUF4870 domain-containing protein [Flavobacteriaceae bacterium]|nr:DUF4870 domain-containing protein [Flavobacteriaceae bacterium]